MFLYSGLQRSKVTLNIFDSNLCKTVNKHSVWILEKKLILGCLKSTKHLPKRILAPNIFYLLLLFHNDIYYISFIIIKKNFFQSFRIASCHLHLPCIPAWTDLTFFLTPHVFSKQMQNLSIFGTVCLVMFTFFFTFFIFFR